MSGVDLNDAETTNRTGTRDHAYTNASTPARKMRSGRVLGIDGGRPRVEAAHIDGGNGARDQDHDPGHGRSLAEVRVGESLLVEVDGHDLGHARRAAAGQQPDLGEDAER